MQKASFENVELGALLGRVQALAGTGARFVQMHAEHNADGERFNLIYTFLDLAGAVAATREQGSYTVANLLVEGVGALDDVPSISAYYPAVFPFENEAHDLFGIHIANMAVDFGGFFYHVAVDKPMSTISPEVKAAREKAAKVRAAKEAKARKAAREAAAAAGAEAGAAAAGAAGGAAGGKAAGADKAAASAGKAVATGSDAAHDDAEAARALKRAQMEAKLASMSPEQAAKVRAALAAKEARDRAKATATSGADDAATVGIAAAAAEAPAATASADAKEAE